MLTAHVVVIGSGVAGASTAFALARRGASVTVVDAARDGVATAAGAGIVEPWSSATADGPFYDLYARGAEYYPTLLERLGDIGARQVDFRRAGALVVSADPAELDAAEDRLRRRRRPGSGMGVVSRLSGAQARELFPPLAPGLAAVHVAGGARVDGRTLRTGLLQAASRLGATVRAGVATLVEDSGGSDGGPRVRVDGDEITADAVVVAAGAWTDAVLEPLGHRLSVAPQRGQITHLRLDGVDTTHWPSVLPLTGHYLVPFDDSRVVVGATRETGSGFDPRVTATGQIEVLRAALTVAPGLADATVLETRVGLRPVPADGLPYLGALTASLFVNAGFGAGGLTMAPVAGEMLADLVLNGVADAGLERFAPASRTAAQHAGGPGR